MISILLPVYNYACSALLSELHLQLTSAGVPFEIIIMEDGSIHHLKENSHAASKFGCNYMPLPHNIGRSAIRNRLAKEAKYEWLLFMDCDSRIPRPDYIRKYLEYAAQSEESVICGGRIFGKKEEIEPEYLLHWYCGTIREPKSDEDNEEKAFLSNNFMIRKSVFESVRFEERLKGYGHEDTLFGMALRKANYRILYIDNPVYHEGLDSNEAFLIKSRMAIINLRTLKDNFLQPHDCSYIKLLYYYDKLQPFYLDHVFAKIYDLFHTPIEKQLKSKKPNLYLFDLYKLGFLCKVMQIDRQQLHRTVL